MAQWKLEVCIPKCHFPGTWSFPQKSGKSSIQSIREHPLSRPDSVPAFRTGFFLFRLSLENETGIPKFNKKSNLNNGYCCLSYFFVSWVTEKDEKTCFNAETNNFNQRTACRAPIWWSKYTTGYPGSSTLAYIVASWTTAAMWMMVAIKFILDSMFDSFSTLPKISGLLHGQIL